jgi:hypothetical protein
VLQHDSQQFLWSFHGIASHTEISKPVITVKLYTLQAGRQSESDEAYLVLQRDYG